MSYAKLTKTQVRKAFAALKDLAKDVELIQEGIDSFNFKTGETETSANPTKLTRAVIVEKKQIPSLDQQAKATSSLKMQMLLIAEDVDDTKLNSYSSVKIDEVIWNIILPFKSDGYVLTVDIVRS